MTYDEISDRMVAWAVGEPDVRALWIEGAAIAQLRRPYRSLELHLAADEPAFPRVVAALSQGLPWIPGARVLAIAETRRFAKEIALEAQGLPFTLIAEQSYLLAKRPRAEVVPLIDKTGHVTHVMDFSLRL
ncbi:MAG: hypothetical protein HY721_13700 [Planctomycetes bacterium]|nr:hypothetical protein [Planctomycetota bacterium]